MKAWKIIEEDEAPNLSERDLYKLMKAMVGVISKSLNYAGIGKKMLMVDELPQGALAKYDQEVAEIAYCKYEYKGRNKNGRRNIPRKPNGTKIARNKSNNRKSKS